MSPSAYFERTSPRTFRPTVHATGAWNPDEQHISPSLGLLAHCIELDRHERRSDDLVVGRVSCDIFGTVPVDEVEVDVEVIRPGRTIELVCGTLRHGGKTIAQQRTWHLVPGDTAALAGTDYEPMPSREDMEVFDLPKFWKGGFIASAEMYTTDRAPGRARSWIRPTVELIHGEETSQLARTVGLLDIANGIALRVDPTEAVFPNLDLVAHMFREPEGEWTGFDTRVSIGPNGVGETASVLHDAAGAFGTLAQCLTVRPSA